MMPASQTGVVWLCAPPSTWRANQTTMQKVIRSSGSTVNAAARGTSNSGAKPTNSTGSVPIRPFVGEFEILAVIGLDANAAAGSLSRERLS